MAKKSGKRSVITVKTKGSSPSSGKRGSQTNGPKKKTASGKKAGGPKGELISLLDGLEPNEITWLLTQAKTMMYNKKVAELNEAAEDLASAKKKTANAPGRETKTSQGNAVDVVQAGSSKNFNIIMGNAHLFLNLAELKQLVRIAQAAGNAGDGAGRLFRWCRRERTDMINDAGLTGPGDARLGTLYEILRERYSVE